MTVKYNIEATNKSSAGFLESLNENFDIFLIKRQHFIEGETLYIDGNITKIKSDNMDVSY